MAEGEELSFGVFGPRVNPKRLAGELQREAGVKEKDISYVRDKRSFVFTLRSLSSKEEARLAVSGLATKKQRMVFLDEEPSTPGERLNRQVTPLWRLSYEKQLEHKKKEIEAILEAGGVSKTVDRVIAASKTEGYRNKAEFAIGRDEAGEIAVGFSLGSFGAGQTALCRADGCLHIPAAVKKAAALFEGFVSASKFAVFDRKSETGVWRMPTVRLHSTGFLFCVQIDGRGIDAEAEAELEAGIADFFSALQLDGGTRVQGVFIQKTEQSFWGSAPAEKAPFRLLCGEGQAQQHLMGCVFSVSIDSFFQTNMFCVEKLYSEVARQALAGGARRGVLLDLCSGTGTIGIVLAKHFGHVVGVELCRSAVQMAEENALLSGLENISFRCGAVEDVLPGLVEEHRGRDIVVVLDPPRAGAPRSVMKTIEAAAEIQRVVYVSCALKQASRSISRAVDSGSLAVAECTLVDMFPHTRHCEAVLRLERKEGAASSRPAE